MNGTGRTRVAGGAVVLALALTAAACGGGDGGGDGGTPTARPSSPATVAIVTPTNGDSFPAWVTRAPNDG